MVLTEGAQGLPSAVHQGGVDDALVLPGQWPEFGGQGEGNHEVVAWHQTLGLPLYPGLTLVVLAVRAVAMATRMRHQTLLAAACALGGQGRAAALHDAQGFALAGHGGLPVLGQIVGLKAFDDGGKRDHLTPAQSMATWRKVFCTPPRSNGVVAKRAPRKPPCRLGKISSGLRCVCQKRRSTVSVAVGSGTKRSRLPLESRTCTRKRTASMSPTFKASPSLRRRPQAVDGEVKDAVAQNPGGGEQGLREWWFA